MRPLTLALTGGLASGKSTALAEFARLGARTVSCDAIVHGLLEGRAGHRAVARAFGKAALARDGRVDRAALARLVFRSPARRKRLEGLLHPRVLAEVSRRLPKSGVAVIDVPLLFEAGAERRFDLTASVDAGGARRQLERAARRGMTRADARARMRAQLPAAEKARRADIVIDNSDGRTRLRVQVRRIFQALELIARAKRR